MGLAIVCVPAVKPRAVRAVLVVSISYVQLAAALAVIVSVRLLLLSLPATTPDILASLMSAIILFRFTPVVPSVTVLFIIDYHHLLL